MKKLFSIALLVVCGAVLAFALVGCGSSDQAKSRSSESFSAASDVSSGLSGTKNILIIGDDEWESYKPGHADMMCLMKVDFDNHVITEVSVPRDTKWKFSDGTYGKLNYVYTNEGAAAQTQAASEIVGEPIDYYIVVNFDGLESIVDHFGGVEVNLPFDVDYSFYTNDYPNEVFQAGEQTLNSWRAMAISRARTSYTEHAAGAEDYVRQYVDRMMLTQFMQYAYSNADGIGALLTLLQNCIKTNIPLDDQIAIAEALGSTGSILVKGTTGPFAGGIDSQAKDQWLVSPDQKGWSALMAAVDKNADANEIATVINSSFKTPPYVEEIPVVTETTISVAR